MHYAHIIMRAILSSRISKQEHSNTVTYGELFKGFFFKCRCKLGYFTIWTGQNKVLITDYMII